MAPTSPPHHQYLTLTLTLTLKETTYYTQVEMQQPHPQAAPGTASDTLYAMAGPADDLLSAHKEGNNDGGSEEPPTYSTVDHPAGPPAAPTAPPGDSPTLYHTVGQH